MPLERSHEDGLKRAADDPAIWPFLFQDGSGTGFPAWWQRALEAHLDGSEVVFTVLLNESQQVIGSTRYFNIALPHRRLEIGHTWYQRDVWGGKVNPECKLLLMCHAFEQMGCNRVEFRCDRRNTRSWEAIKRLGAVEEGILRHHMVVQGGFVRDTVQFSVVSDEWPQIKGCLEARLAD